MKDTEAKTSHYAFFFYTKEKADALNQADKNIAFGEMNKLAKTDPVVYGTMKPYQLLNHAIDVISNNQRLTMNDFGTTYKVQKEP